MFQQVINVVLCVLRREEDVPAVEVTSGLRGIQGGCPGKAVLPDQRVLGHWQRGQGSVVEVPGVGDVQTKLRRVGRVI